MKAGRRTEDFLIGLASGLLAIGLMVVWAPRPNWQQAGVTTSPDIAAGATAIAEPATGMATAPSRPVPEPTGSSNTRGSTASIEAAPTVAAGPGPAIPDVPPMTEAPVVRWLPIGPASPGDPGGEFWYALIKDKRCETLSANVSGSGSPDPLWTAAVHFCGALVSGNESSWTQGAADLARTARPQSSRCLDAAVYEALVRLSEFHSLHPETTAIPLVAEQGTACPLRFSGLGPDQGSICGGEQVRLMGRLLGVAEIVVDGVSVPVRQSGENHFEFVTPAHPAEPVSISVFSRPSPELPALLLGTATFTYMAESFPCPEPSVSPSPEPSATRPGTPSA
ncbi:IPT/TIG domain-containing protein [Arthrobacter sp. M4]|uniref:IPT/TIG domain-containing protein n=1 Tax=Arthrobacter sp. M4 TaxID=218160 RepID=UPI0035ABC268